MYVPHQQTQTHRTQNRRMTSIPTRAGVTAGRPVAPHEYLVHEGSWLPVCTVVLCLAQIIFNCLTFYEIQCDMCVNCVCTLPTVCCGPGRHAGYNTDLGPLILQVALKQELAASPARHYRGYQALGVNVTRFQGGFQRDWHEALDFFREEHAGKIKVTGGPCGCGGIYPRAVPQRAGRATCQRIAVLYCRSTWHAQREAQEIWRTWQADEAQSLSWTIIRAGLKPCVQSDSWVVSVPMPCSCTVGVDIVLPGVSHISLCLTWSSSCAGPGLHWAPRVSPDAHPECNTHAIQCPSGT